MIIIKCLVDHDVKLHTVIYNREGMLDFFWKDDKLDKDGINNVSEEDEVRRMYFFGFY